MDRTRRGQVVAFVGAGLSMQAGLPSWRTLMDTLIAECIADTPRKTSPDVEELSRMARGSPLDMLMVAQELRERLGRRRFKEVMEATFRAPDCQPADVHRSLTRLPLAAVLTTNYDKLVETAFAVANADPPRIILPSNEPAIAALGGSDDFYILKLHGDIDEIDSVVIGVGDYRKASQTNHLYRITLEALLRDKTLMFLGYSLNDPGFVLLLDQVRGAFQGYNPGHFALMAADRVGPIAARRFEEDYGIRVLTYVPSEGHPEVANFLADLVTAVGAPGPRRRQPSKANPIRIGILHSLTGTMALSEPPLVDAALMAVDELNGEGGLLGREVVPIVEDGESEGSVFATRAQKLLVSDRVCSLFGVWTSAHRKAVIRELEKVGGLLWYPLQYEGGEQSPHVIYTGATPNQQILPAVRWCLDQGWSRVFLVGSDYVFPQEAHRIVKAFLTLNGGSCVGESYVALGEWKSVGRVVRAIREAEPDVVLNTLNGDSNIPFFRAHGGRGARRRVAPVVSSSIGEVELRQIGTQYTTGHYCAWNYFMSIDTPENRRFVREFKRRYGSERVTDDPIEAAYLQVRIFGEAVKAARSTDWRDIRNKVRGMNYAAPGGPVRIDPHNQHVWSEARIGQIQRDGQFKLVWSSDGLLAPEPFLFAEGSEP